MSLKDGLFADYATCFKRNQIDGEQLVNLTHEHLFALALNNTVDPNLVEPLLRMIEQAKVTTLFHIFGFCNINPIKYGLHPGHKTWFYADRETFKWIFF